MKFVTFLLIFWVLFPLGRSYAQNLSAGGVFGTNLTANFEPFPTVPGFSYSNTQSLIAGAAAEWRFRGSLSFEVDVLYHQLHAGAPFGAHFSVVTWEFPVLAKYRLPLRRVTSFVEAGPSFRATGNLNDIHPSHAGFTAGVGVARNIRRWRLEPALRYTRWGADLEQANVRTRTDQIELLLGFRAPALSNSHPFGPHIALGAVVGTNLTGDFGSATTSAFPPALANIASAVQLASATFESSAGPRSLLAGPQIAVPLPRRFSIAVEGIDHPLRSTVEVLLAGGRTLILNDRRSTWQFPILVQHRWRIGPTTPFVEAGPSFRLLQDVYGAAPYGVVAGAGIERRVGPVRIAPGVRLTHWARPESSVATDPRRNEVALLTAFAF